jgi:hypothetical protein
MSNFPVFILGIPRSGTTFLRLLLNNHPQIAIPDETGIFLQLYNRPGQPKSILKLLNYAPNAIVTNALGVEIIEAYKKLSIILKPKTPSKIIDWLFSAYARSQNKKIWGEKTPIHLEYIKDILKIFPQGRIIYLLRDPRAVVSSYLRYKDARNRTANDVFISDSVEEAVTKYKQFMQSSITFDNIAKQKTIYFINYEKLVLETQKQLKYICEQILEVEYSEKMLDYAATANLHLTNKTSRKKGNLHEWKSDNTREIDEKLVDRWKQELSNLQIKYINKELSSYIEWQDKIFKNMARF